MADMKLEDQEGYWDLCSGLGNNPQPTLTISDVVSIEAFWTDGSEEPSFAWLLRLSHGAWAAVTGSHDYTGWDCSSGMSSSIYESREDAIRWGLTLNDRENLGLALPEDKT